MWMARIATEVLKILFNEQTESKSNHSKRKVWNGEEEMVSVCRDYQGDPTFASLKGCDEKTSQEQKTVNDLKRTRSTLCLRTKIYQRTVPTYCYILVKRQYNQQKQRAFETLKQHKEGKRHPCPVGVVVLFRLSQTSHARIPVVVFGPAWAGNNISGRLWDDHGDGGEWHNKSQRPGNRWLMRDSRHCHAIASVAATVAQSLRNAKGE